MSEQQIDDKQTLLQVDISLGIYTLQTISMFVLQNDAIF